MKQLLGIHHISAIMADPQATVNFYRDVLGLQLVKKTIANDDVSKYHLYFALNEDHSGFVSFFERDAYISHQEGSNCISSFSLMVASIEALHYWRHHLIDHQVEVSEIQGHFDWLGFSFVDLNGITIHIMVDPNKTAKAGHAFLGFGPIVIDTANIEASNRWFSKHLQFKHVMNFKNQRLYTNDNQTNPSFIILNPNENQPHSQGVGSIDHVAFLVESIDDLQEFYDAFFALGDYHSNILDRMYYHSLYVRNPISIMFEFTDNNPGFGVDEPQGKWGHHLSLPHYLEPFRKEISANLSELKIDSYFK